MNMCDRALTEVLAKFHRVIWERQSRRIAISDKRGQLGPFEKELARMIPKRGHHSALVPGYYFISICSGSQRPSTVPLTSEDVGACLLSELVADWRYEIPELV